MPVKDIFDKPFDEGTILKLEIFEKYFEEWLPTFIMGTYPKPIQVFDLFAGSGYDKNNIAGSPIRILEIINKHRGNLSNKSKKVFLFFNDSDENKIDQLKINVEAKTKELSLTSLVEIKFSSNNFRECFGLYRKELNNGCNLIFIDQNGFKEVDEKVFYFLINLDTTEFIFFISSSYIHRFADAPEVQKHHPKFDFEKIKLSSRRSVHNTICEEYHKYVPKSVTNFLLIPFSIMKDDKSNVYGLIFVCKHPLAADKFLHIVWNKNLINGNANFDIDADLQKSQLHLFDGKKPTKIESFQNKLRESILAGSIKTNKDAYLFTLNQGHISQHANEEIKRMKKENKIIFDSSSSLVNYDKVIKENRIIEYKLVKDETN
ncbi:MAG: three-Cys-motif partner protein TcmP [Bacteroidota bacterium]